MRRLLTVVLAATLATACTAISTTGGDTGAPPTSAGTAGAPASTAGDPAGPTTQPDAPAPPTEAPPEPTLAPEDRFGYGLEAGPGAAWIGGVTCGLAVLSADGTWATVDDTGLWPIHSAFEVTAAADGTVYVITSEGTFSVSGPEWTQLPTVGYSSLQHLALDPSGTLWGATYRGVARFEDGEWVEIPFGEGEDEDFSPDDFAIGPDGRVWVVNGQTVSAYDGDTWATWGPGAGWEDERWLSSIAVDGDGTVWATTGSELLAYDGESWRVEDPGVRAEGVLVAGGLLYVTSWSEGLAVLDGRWRTIDQSNSGLHTGRTRSVAVDGRGRLWVGTDWGLAVLDGDDTTVYTLATSGMAGVCVDALWVDGDGPDLPQPTEPLLGSVTGVVVDGGVPSAGTDVLLCTEPPSTFYRGDHPCTDAYWWAMATSDADGVYRFEDVPIGTYEIAWRVGPTRWRSYLVGGIEPVVRAGEQTHLPEVDIAEED